MKMINFLALVFCFLFTQKSAAQSLNAVKIIGKNDSLKLKLVRSLDNKKYYLISTRKAQKDAILISTSQTEWQKDTCIIRQMQLNQLGAPEVILESTQANQLETQSNSSFTTVQIWDVDSQMQMFNGTKKWYSEIELLSKTKLDNNYEPTIVTSICEGSYEIDFLNDGSLLIKNLTQRAINTDYCETDHVEGKYILSEGKYKLIK
jgi:hypothetical protein